MPKLVYQFKPCIAPIRLDRYSSLSRRIKRFKLRGKLIRISVIERASIIISGWNHKALTSKVHLDTLMGTINKFLEYWSHAAAYLPHGGLSLSMPRKQAIASGKKHWTLKKKHPLTVRCCKRIRARRAFASKDLNEESGPPKNSGGAIEKPLLKKPLEQAFYEGELMVLKLRAFQKVYD